MYWSLWRSLLDKTLSICNLFIRNPTIINFSALEFPQNILLGIKESFLSMMEIMFSNKKERLFEPLTLYKASILLTIPNF